MRPQHHYTLLFLAALILLPIAALAVRDSLDSRQYQYGFSTSGGPPGWSVWIEDLVFNGGMGVPAGTVSDPEWDEPPGLGAISIAMSRPFPAHVSARWFSFRTQTFYEIDLELPQDVEERIRPLYRQHPPSRGYRHRVMTGISGEGRIRLWWRISCVGSCEMTDPILIPIIEEAYGWQADGDPSHYQRRTQRRRDEGRIPPEPEPPPR